jgi:hypothetical protein
MIIKPIEAVKAETLEKIRNISAFSLPSNPSERGMTPEQIKARFYMPILAQASSVISELGRVIAEANAALGVLDKLFEGQSIVVDGEEITLDGLILMSEKGGVSLKDYFSGLEPKVESWLAKAKEVDTLVLAAENSKKGAESARAGAESAKTGAETARAGAESARDRILDLVVRSVSCAPSVEPSVEKTELGGVTQLTFYLPTGKPFRVAAIFSSVAEMEAGYASDGVGVGEFVTINTGNVEDEENARLYVKGDGGYSFVADLSGASGIRGTDGYTPVRGVDFMTEADFAYFDAHIDERLGEVGTALDELHAYAQALAAGGEAV